MAKNKRKMVVANSLLKLAKVFPTLIEIFPDRAVLPGFTSVFDASADQICVEGFTKEVAAPGETATGSRHAAVNKM